MRCAMNRTVGDKTHESARYGSFLTVERPSRKGFDRLGLILIRQALEGRLPLFTKSPRRLILGNSGHEKSRGVENPGGKASWTLYRRKSFASCPAYSTVTMPPNNKAVKG